MSENKERSKKAKALGLKYDELNDCYVKCTKDNPVGVLHENSDDFAEIKVDLDAVITKYDGTIIHVKDSYPVLKDTSIKMSEESSAPQDNPCLYIYIPEFNDGLYLGDEDSCPIVDISAFDGNFDFDDASGPFAEIKPYDFISGEELAAVLNEEWTKKISEWNANGSSALEKIPDKFVSFNKEELKHAFEVLLDCLSQVQVEAEFKNNIILKIQAGKLFAYASEGHIMVKYKLSPENDFSVLGEEPVFLNRDFVSYFLSLDLTEQTIQLGTADAVACLKCGNLILGQKYDKKIKVPGFDRVLSQPKPELSLTKTPEELKEILNKITEELAAEKNPEIQAVESEQIKNLFYYSSSPEEKMFSEENLSVAVFNKNPMDWKKFACLYDAQKNSLIKKGIDFGPFCLTLEFVAAIADFCEDEAAVLNYKDSKSAVIVEHKDNILFVMPRIS